MLWVIDNVVKGVGGEYNLRFIVFVYIFILEIGRSVTFFCCGFFFWEKGSFVMGFLEVLSIFF